MPDVADPIAPRADPLRRLRKFLFELLMISAPVLTILIVELVGNRLTDNRWDWDIHETSVLEDVVVYPLFYIVLRYFLPWAKRREEVFLASPDSASKLDGEAAAERDRQCVRVVTAGFAIGLLLALVGMGLGLAWKGWRIFAEKEVGQVIAFPIAGASIAILVTRLPGDPSLPWRRVRFRLFSLMVVVAYVALILGLSFNTRATGFRALSHHAKWKSASRSAAFCREQIRQRKGPVEYFRIRLLYDQKLVEKYRKAEQHPSDPVDPDPPPP